MNLIMKTPMKDLMKLDDYLGLTSQSIKQRRESTLYCDLATTLCTYLYCRGAITVEEFQMSIMNYSMIEDKITSYSLFNVGQILQNMDRIQYEINNIKVRPVFDMDMRLYAKTTNFGIIISTEADNPLKYCMREEEIKNLMYYILKFHDKCISRYGHALSLDKYMDDTRRFVVNELYSYEIKNLIDMDSIQNSIDNINNLLKEEENNG